MKVLSVSQPRLGEGVLTDDLSESQDDLFLEAEEHVNGFDSDKEAKQRVSTKQALVTTETAATNVTNFSNANGDGSSVGPMEVDDTDCGTPPEVRVEAAGCGKSPSNVCNGNSEEPHTPRGSTPNITDKEAKPIDPTDKPSDHQAPSTDGEAIETDKEITTPGSTPPSPEDSKSMPESCEEKKSDEESLENKLEAPKSSTQDSSESIVKTFFSSKSLLFGKNDNASKLSEMPDYMKKALEFDFLEDDLPVPKTCRKAKCKTFSERGWQDNSILERKSSYNKDNDEVDADDVKESASENASVIDSETAANDSPNNEDSVFNANSFMEDSIDICSGEEHCYDNSVPTIIKNSEDDDSVCLNSDKENGDVDEIKSDNDNVVAGKKVSTNLEDSNVESSTTVPLFSCSKATKTDEELLLESAPSQEIGSPVIMDIVDEETLLMEEGENHSLEEMKITKDSYESDGEETKATEDTVKPTEEILESNSNKAKQQKCTASVDTETDIIVDDNQSVENYKKDGVEKEKGKRSHESGEETESAVKKMKVDPGPKEAPSPEPQPDPIQETSSMAKGADSPCLRIKNLSDMEEKTPTKSETAHSVMAKDNHVVKNIKTMTRNELEQMLVKKTIEAIAVRSKLSMRDHEIVTMKEKVVEYKKKIQPLTKQVHDLSNVILRLEQSTKKNPKPTRPLKVTRSVGLQVTVNNNQQGGPAPPKASPTTPPARGIRTLRPVNRPASTPSPQQVQPPRPTPQPPSPATPQYGKLRVSLPGQGLPAPGVRTLPPSASILNTSPVQARTTAAPVMTRVNSGIRTISPVVNSQTSSIVSAQSAASRTVDLSDSDKERSTVRTQQINLVQQPGGRLSIIPPQTGNPPVAYLLQAPQSRPVLLTPTHQSAGRGINPMSLNTVQWVQSIPKTVGTQPSILQRQIAANPGNLKTGQVTVRQTAPGVPLQRGSLYTVGPTVASFQRSPNVRAQDINVVVMQHPAPLPPIPPSPVTSRIGWKLPPPKPVLKISRVPSGIVLSWNMTLSPDHEDMKSYQIYAYQESKDPPSSALWKTVGDVKALALPMACTLTQFKDGHKYHFAVRAVDIHSRMGPHSDPTSIVLYR